MSTLPSRPDAGRGPDLDAQAGPVPPAVITLLTRVRETGRTNMLVYAGVLGVASELADEPEDYVAWVWLVDHRGRYVEALQAMVHTRRETVPLVVREEER